MQRGKKIAPRLELPENVRTENGCMCSERCPAFDGKRCDHLIGRAPAYSGYGPCPVWVQAAANVLGVDVSGADLGINARSEVYRG